MMQKKHRAKYRCQVVAVLDDARVWESPSPVASVSSSVLRCCFAHRSPQALQRVFGPCGPCQITDIRINRPQRRRQRTFRHSGESVRPHITHTCCSSACIFLSWIIKCQGERYSLKGIILTFFFLNPSSDISSSITEFSVYMAVCGVISELQKMLLKELCIILL